MSYTVQPPSPEPIPFPPPFKIEAVTTCVNHSDFLAYTLPVNRQHFDRLIVCTSPEDKATQRVCDYYGVRYHATDAFASRWEQFRKGAAINEGLGLLERDCWLLHLDADIVLPPNFREVLVKADLDTTMIYGADRVEFKSFAEWQRFIGSPEPHTQGNGFFIHIEHTGQRFGTRVAFQHHGGYIPIGYFQLWHADSGVSKYPEGHSDAGREDSHFPTLWPRKKRALIPEVIVYHLESEPAPMATNWQKRVTKPFGL